MDAIQLREILQVLKDFELTNVRLKINDLELDCHLPAPAKPAPFAPRLLSPHPAAELKYHSALTTKEELEVLGLAGVDPSKDPDKPKKSKKAKE